ncbi:hypothetical protein B0H63DRAFT_546961 [Podospora didyma]|uniref:Apple domain-containing protein n=1 Tax=Podospora didyma TaxID=330526 RepID=A0AAE0KJM7_9PEZI|nr:hypothetical protein B0H63DRAFT_546961 [Podospora didyma]
MKVLTVLGSAAILTGQVAASLNCTVMLPALTKRLCEFDSCPAFGTATAGEVIHAGCVADCSSADDPWLKLHDGTFVQASDATLQGCQNFCEASSINTLPRCHQLTGLPKPTNCSASLMVQLALIDKNPTPLGAEMPPTKILAAKCSLPWTGVGGIVSRYTLLHNRTTTVATLHNRTMTERHNRTTTAAIHNRTVETTTTSSLINNTDHVAVLNSTHVLPRLWYKARGLIPRTKSGSLNLTRVEGNNTTATVVGTTGSAVHVRDAPKAMFTNGTYNNATAVERRSPAVRKGPIPPVPFSA